jgi:hypothetical protein
MNNLYTFTPIFEPRVILQSLLKTLPSDQKEYFLFNFLVR